VASAAAFAISPGVGWLLVGRITSGLASRAVTAVAPAALAELEPDNDLSRASVVASAASRRFRRTIAAAAAVSSVTALSGVGAASAHATIPAHPSAPVTHGWRGSGGHLYGLTNSALGNAVVVYERGADGALSKVNTVSTGGTGSGPPVSAGFEQSQNGLILAGYPGAEVTPFHSLLFAVNPGSNEISVLSVHGDDLTLADKVASGGIKPTSLTVHDNILYVMHAGLLPLGEGATPSISGFRIVDSGRGVRLEAIRGATYQLTGAATTLGPLEAGAAEIQFATDGRTLTVSERNSNVLDNFVVRGDSTLVAPPIATEAGDGTLFGIPSPLGTASPFGFAASQHHPGQTARRTPAGSCWTTTSISRL